MRNFVRQSRKRGRCNAFNQYYNSIISDNVFGIISKELDIDGNICEILDNNFEFLINYEKLYAKKFHSKYYVSRDISRNEKSDFINHKLNKLAIKEQLSKLDLNNTQMDFDATSLYLSAMRDNNSVYPTREFGFAFKPHMKEV